MPVSLSRASERFNPSVLATFMIADTGAPEYDPVEGVMLSGVYREEGVMVHVRKRDFKQSLEDNNPPATLSVYALIDDFSFVPEVAQKVSLEGVVYRVTEVSRSTDYRKWEISLSL